MTGYVKQNGIYVPMDNIFVKQNGVYENVDTAYVKQNGVYEVWFNAGGSGGDPQEDLDFIQILNDTVSTSNTYRETELGGITSNESFDSNLWGQGKNKDSEGVEILSGSYCVKMPMYIPQLNVDTTWLNSKGISISGTIASISRKAVNINQNAISGSNTSLHKPNSAVATVISEDVYDNLDITILNNNILLQSKERQTKGAFKFSSSQPGYWPDALYLTRRYSNYGGIKVRYSEVSSNFSSIDGYCHWRIEVDVNYNLIFFHAASGLSRTINKTVKFRTYN